MSAELILRCASSAVLALAGSMKASGQASAKMQPFGYPDNFAEVLGIAEVAMATLNLGGELGLARVAAGNVWIQRLTSLIMGGALWQHAVAGDGGYAAPLAMLAVSGAVPALRGDAASPQEAAGVALALAAAGIANQIFYFTRSLGSNANLTQAPPPPRLLAPAASQ